MRWCGPRAVRCSCCGASRRMTRRARRTVPVSESGIARALYRGAVCLVALVILVALGLQVKWVLVQLFAAAIVAAGMAPVVGYVTRSARAQSWRWRPPAALVVIGIYIVVGGFLLLVASILLQALVTQGA